MADTSTAPATDSQTKAKFGTFGGVFTPSILTILGVILFMRANFVVGQAGVRNALIILIISKTITTLTGFSISAIATNTTVKGGGAYFLISRTLGPEFGGTIGIALYCAQALSVPFYILGFTEAMTLVFPALTPSFRIICFVTLVALFIIAFIGAHWAIKTQYAIMGVLVLSIATFMVGLALSFDPATLAANWKSASGAKSLSFWAIFAIYFPAVTGIMAGVNMSGDLKKPAFSLPTGTFLAIFTGMAVYGVHIVLAGGAIPREELVNDPFGSLVNSAILGMGFMVALGVFCATLSSALGSLLGAPRILQALAVDDILKPIRPFARLSAGGEPRRALWLTLVLSIGVIYFAGNGDGGEALNVIASLVTMLFLVTYGITNLAAFVESFGRNPSFRPRFRFFHWILALGGAAGCGFAAALINPGAALGAVVIVGMIFLYVKKFVLATSFGDARRGFVYTLIRDNLIKLAALPIHPKNWRPTSLVLTGNPNSRLTLVKYAKWMGSGRGIVVLVAVLIGELEKLFDQRAKMIAGLETFIHENNLQAFPQVLVTPHFDWGLNQLFQVGSVGPLKPNMVVLGFPTDVARAGHFVKHLATAQMLGISQIVINDSGLPDLKPRQKKTIDIWWRGKNNGSLMVILAYLVSLNSDWTNTNIRILRMVRSKEEQKAAWDELRQLCEAARIRADILVVVANSSFRETLHAYSSAATVVFLGFRIPQQPDAASFQQNMATLLKGLPTTILVHSTGEADVME